MNAQGEAPALLDLLRQAALKLARLLAEGLGLRARLAQLEATELVVFWACVAALAAAATGLVATAWLFANLGVILYWWETHRVRACGGVVLGNIALAAAALGYASRRVRRAPEPFQATLAELRRDVQTLVAPHD